LQFTQVIAPYAMQMYAEVWIFSLD
jgi:hypothetical protein